MGSDTNKPCAAYAEECDEDDEVVRGTRLSSSTKKKSSKGEGQSRSFTDKNSRRDSGYSSQTVITGSEKSSSLRSTRSDVANEDPSTDRESRRKSSSHTSARSPRKSSRPPLTRNNFTSPAQLEMPVRTRPDPSYYGISPNSTTVPNTSTKLRRQSYHAGMPIPIPAPSTVDTRSRPPMAPSAFYNTPSPIMPTSYPASSYMRYAPSQSDSYFVPEPPRVSHLADRFNRNADPITRTTSAQGIRALTDGFLSQAESAHGIRRRAKEVEDLQRMPPPPLPVMRPAIHRIDTNVPVSYSSEVFDDDRYYDQHSARPTYRNESPALRAPRRLSANRGPTYDYGRGDGNGNYRTETSDRRRASYYEGQPHRSNTYEDKIREAAGYQEAVAGPSVSLTAEALRKQQQATTSSRSTRSSGSRDESDFKRSATTRTTTSRADPDSEDITIKFRGDATVNIAGAEINCKDGAEVNIIRSKSVRNGSDRSGSEYGTVPTDDRRSRDSRPPNISRSTSKSKYSSPLAPTARYRSKWL